MRTTYRMARWTGAAFLAALAMTGCGHSSSGPGGATTGAGASAGLDGVSPTASATGGPGQNPTSFPASADEYARQALTAWTTGNTDRLDQLRDPGATIFATLSTGNYDKHFTLHQCQGAAGSSSCAFFNNAGDELQLQLSNQLLGRAHAVIGGQFHPITFPTDAKAYAQETLDAWLAHNDARVGLLCGADAAAHLNAIAGSHRGETWTYDHAEGAAGSSYLTWKNAAGDAIVFRFRDPGIPPTPGPQHRVADVIFQPHA
jgi:hypothetical protein